MSVWASRLSRMAPLRNNLPRIVDGLQENTHPLVDHLRENTNPGEFQPQIAESEATFQPLPSPRKGTSLLAGLSACIDLGGGDAEPRGTACGLQLLHSC